MKENPWSRRELLRSLRGAGAGLALAPFALGAPGEEDVAPAEDLMREHGVLNRLLLIYEEAIRRIGARQEFAPRVLSEAAGIVRRFIEEYHEKSEEESLFPRFEKAGKLVDLVAVLRQQHQAGRRVTAEVERLAGRLTFSEARRAERTRARGHGPLPGLSFAREQEGVRGPGRRLRGEGAPPLRQRRVRESGGGSGGAGERARDLRAFPLHDATTFCRRTMRRVGAEEPTPTGRRPCRLPG